MTTLTRRAFPLHSSPLMLLALAACSSSSPDAGVGAVADAGATDALTVVGEDRSDAAVPPATPPDAASTCAPKSLRSAAYHPPRAAAKACTDANIDTFVGCVGNKTGGPECDAFLYPPAPGIETEACVNCIFSRESEAKWGPIVLGDVNVVNIGGCYELVAGAACGAAMHALAVCSGNQCDECSAEARAACVDEARAKPCKAKYEAALAKCPAPGSEAYMTCEGTGGGPGPTVIRSFCGGG